MTKQEQISKALRGEMPAEQWMVESRERSARDADGYASMCGCETHASLSTENFHEAEKLKTLVKLRADVGNLVNGIMQGGYHIDDATDSILALFSNSQLRNEGQDYEKS